MLLDAFSFLGSGALLRRIRPAEPPPDDDEGGVTVGLRWIGGSAVVRPTLLATATLNFFNFVFWALFVLYATRELGVSAGTLGLVLGAGAVGGLLGSVIAAPMSRRIGVGPTLVVGYVLFPVPLLLVPLAGGSDTIVLRSLFLAEFGSGVGLMLLDISAGAIFAAVIRPGCGLGCPGRTRSSTTGSGSSAPRGWDPRQRDRPPAGLWIGTLGALLGCCSYCPRRSSACGSSGPARPVGLGAMGADRDDSAIRASFWAPSPTCTSGRVPGIRVRPSSGSRAPPLDIVDLGAGTGKLTRRLLELGHRVTAVEPLPEMLDRLRAAAPGATAVLGTAEVMPLVDGSADVVTAGQAFHWFDHDRALPEIARVLRPGGRLGVWNMRDEREPWVAKLSEVIGSEDARAARDSCRGSWQASSDRSSARRSSTSNASPERACAISSSREATARCELRRSAPILDAVDTLEGATPSTPRSRCRTSHGASASCARRASLLRHEPGSGAPRGGRGRCGQAGFAGREARTTLTESQT